MIEFVSNVNFAPSNPKAENLGNPLHLQMGHKSEVTQPTYEDVSAKLNSGEIKTRVEALLKQYPVKQGALLEVLWIAQSELGWVPQAAVKWAAKICECSPVHAWGVATFYTMYKHVPTGRFLLQFCQNICCHTAGAEDIISIAEKKLGIKAGETTQDKLFTIARVECLGACGNGPAMLVNDDFATDVVNGNLAMPSNVGLNAERLDKIIAWCKERAAKNPQEPKRDPLGGITGAVHSEPLGLDFAPPPPALGVKATTTDKGVSVIWKIAPEVTSLAVERKNGSKWEAIGSPGIKDKEFIDANGKAGCEYRVIATSGTRTAKPSVEVKS
ncbi:MAG: NAD(P)H-dependent oxidoreductase subunit E [Fibromonadaceae bacterium]|jgi:NADH-quinone oxidoreductase E subunit|nr:NAD(P)H-dependent oxidoreductase subunit E [Fibromonadaceae bacterium]